jgi:NAD(P)H-hydrate epimerase
MGAKVKKISNIEDLGELRDEVINADLTVDALFGTGLSRNVEGIYEAVIAVVNENSYRTVSIDIPSGLHADSGKALGNCIKASKTVTFELYKRGFLNYDSSKYTGEIVVESIGVPEFIIEQNHNNEFILEQPYIKECIARRNKHGHKGDYGRGLIIAGSKGFTGAAFMAAQSAVRSGCGLVTLAVCKEIQEVLSGRITEAMTISYEDKDAYDRLLNNCNAVAIGPGMGNKDVTFELVKEILSIEGSPVIIDADGLNVVSRELGILKTKKRQVIITPHPGEMAKLTGLSTTEINANRMDVAKDFAKEYELVVLLKGYQTVITDGKT